MIQFLFFRYLISGIVIGFSAERFGLPEIDNSNFVIPLSNSANLDLAASLALDSSVKVNLIS